MQWWAWVSVKMRSEFINAFGTHRGFGDTGMGCWARFVAREKGSSS